MRSGPDPIEPAGGSRSGIIQDVVMRGWRKPDTTDKPAGNAGLPYHARHHFLSGRSAGDEGVIRFAGSQHPSEELARPLMARRSQDLRRWTMLRDDAAVHEDHLGRPLPSRSRSRASPPASSCLLRRGRAATSQDLADEFRVQRRCGFVEQHDAWLHGQRAGDRHSLLFATRQPPRIAFAALPPARRAATARKARSSGFSGAGLL